MAIGGELETARKWLHLAPGVLALAVRDLGYVGSIVLTLTLLAFNLYLLPRMGGTRLWRPVERLRGAAPGMLFYPVALVILAVASRGRPEVLAGAWGMLAFGDAAATLVGRRWGRRPLPWNASKTWVGSAAFLAASWLALVLLVEWTARGRYEPGALALAAALSAAAGALVESLAWTLDDNLSVTLAGGSALYVGLAMMASATGLRPAVQPFTGLAVALALGLLASASRVLDLRGSFAGVVLAWCVWLGAGWRGVALLALFVAASAVAGRLRRRRRSGGIEPVRGVGNVLANGAVAGGCGLLAAWEGGGVALMAMLGALAAATADTVGGEIGQAFGGRTRLVTDGAIVPPGTNGGVSWIGSVATVAAAMLMAAAAMAVGLGGGRVVAVVAAAGTGGALLDSLLGATLERRSLLDNEAVNFLSTLAAAWLAAQLAGA